MGWRRERAPAFPDEQPISIPEARTLEAFELEEEGWLRLGAWSEGDQARIPPFDAVEIEVGELFPPAAEGGPG